MFKNNFNLKSKGLILVNVLVFGVVAIVVTSALVNWGATMLKSTRQLTAREQAFQIAEAGIDYYRWHLAHAPTDYTDGNGPSATGPFVHDFEDKDGNVIGQFALTITPPPIGSTMVTIESLGTVVEDPSVERTIRTTLAIPSFAKYAFVANSDMRFGEGTEVFGPIHSNGGIRFDGLAHNIVTSARESYNDPDSDDCNNNSSFGVHTCNPADPQYPNTVPLKPTVFAAGRQFPVPAVDFNGITADLSQMKSDAQSDGRYFASSGAQGYRIVLKTNDTFDIYRVNSLRSAPSGCSNSQAGWGTWSIGTSGSSQTLLQSNQDFPDNGLIFVEDHLWIQGQIDTARLTIAAGRFPDDPANRRNIIINNDVLYTNYDGQDALALIAQGNITTGLFSEDDLRIDSALIAQNGRVGRYYYNTSCESSSSSNDWRRTQLTLYGMIGTSQRYGFTYTGSSYNCGGTIGSIGSGYCSRDIIYDANLLYAPPPSFPLTSDQYSILSWEEVR